MTGGLPLAREIILPSEIERRPQPVADELRAVLDYDPETGALTRRSTGKPVGTVNGRGYVVVGFQGRKLLAHRLAWIITHGTWPKDQIDHVNGIRSDNRLANLRDVSASENSRNQSLRRDNTSGRIGVSFDKRSGKWYAYIRIDGRTVNLGRYDAQEDAVAARAAAEREYGFHANHGRRRAA